MTHDSSKDKILIIIIISYLMMVLDISIVVTALPKIHASLNFTNSELTWVQSTYNLAFGGFLLLGARAGDLFGRKRMFLLGIGIFTFASLVIGLSESAFQLLFGRALQGLGAAVLGPSTLALLSTNFKEGPERTRAVSYYTSVIGLGTSIGLVIGGFLTHLFSWRMGFFLNIPIGIAMLVLAPKYITETEKHTGHLDVWGAISSTLGMTSLVYSIVRSSKTGWGDNTTWIFFICGLAFIALFVLNEWRAKQPIMPLRLFKSSRRCGAYIGRFLFLGSMMGYWFYMTQYLQKVLHLTPSEAGLAFLPMTVTNFFVAMVVPNIVKKIGNDILLAASLIIAAIGMFWISKLTPEASYWTSIALPMVLLGIGRGGALSPLTSIGISEVESRDAGAASGVVNAFHQLGVSFGVAVLTFAFAWSGSEIVDETAQLAHRISVAFAASSGLLAIALVVTAILILRNSRPKI